MIELFYYIDKLVTLNDEEKDKMIIAKYLHL